MGSTYQRVALADPDADTPSQRPTEVPNSPPPSFRSRDSSRHRPSGEDRELNDAFDSPSDDDSDDGNVHYRQRLLRRRPSVTQPTSEVGNDAQELPAVPTRSVTEIPVFAPTSAQLAGVGGGNRANDGVWANLSAKPRAGDDAEEKPPTYEQAAADATPPYWETTVFSPYASSGNPDDVFVDGLLVGSVFSFIWNGLISMSFQLIGFLLTYLLHTTHAAKNGSRAGLGITLINYGIQMRRAGPSRPTDVGGDSPVDAVPTNPNAHDFDPADPAGQGDRTGGSVSTAEILSYVLMLAGWFILIRSVSDFLRARRQEALVRSSPDRGLGVAVVAEGEPVESSV